jgi:polyferredoxin
VDGICHLVYGNILVYFCGWICPQTIFLEIFSEELNWIEGVRGAQIGCQNRNGMPKIRKEV